MDQQKRVGDAGAAYRAAKVCPWCGGALKFDPQFPVDRLVAGESRLLRYADLPSSILALPAWVCATPLCRFREPA
jgi:hypothetical protein